MTSPFGVPPNGVAEKYAVPLPSADTATPVKGVPPVLPMSAPFFSMGLTCSYARPSGRPARAEAAQSRHAKLPMSRETTAPRTRDMVKSVTLSSVPPPSGDVRCGRDYRHERFLMSSHSLLRVTNRTDAIGTQSETSLALEAASGYARAAMEPSLQQASPAGGQRKGRQPHQLPAGRHGLTRSYVLSNQRDRIVGSVIEVVSETGYAGLTVRGVVERAGVSRRTFYEHFSNKQDVFLAVYDVVVERLAGDVRLAYASGRTTRNRWPSGSRPSSGGSPTTQRWRTSASLRCWLRGRTRWRGARGRCKRSAT